MQADVLRSGDRDAGRQEVAPLARRARGHRAARGQCAARPVRLPDPLPGLPDPAPLPRLRRPRSPSARLAAGAGGGGFLGTAAGARLKLGRPDVSCWSASRQRRRPASSARSPTPSRWPSRGTLIAGIANSLGKLSLDAIIQREVPDWLRASAFGRSETAAAAGLGDRRRARHRAAAQRPDRVRGGRRGARFRAGRDSGQQPAVRSHRGYRTVPGRPADSVPPTGRRRRPGRIRARGHLTGALARSGLEVGGDRSQ